MEEQEDLSWRPRWGHCYLGPIRSARIPLAQSGLPLPHTLTCSALPLVKCHHLHQQVKALLFYFFIRLCKSLLIYLLVYVLFARSPPHIPEVIIPEDLTVQIALSLRYEINRGFAVLREIASGRDLKKFLIVC